MKNIKLELGPDFDMHIFFDKSARGGISYILIRYRKNNKIFLKS